MDINRWESLRFFDDMEKMDMNRAGSMSTNPLAKGIYFGYVDKCENQILLDRVVAAALNAPGDEVDLSDACVMAGVDPNSLTADDIQYIVEKVNG